MPKCEKKFGVAATPIKVCFQNFARKIVSYKLVQNYITKKKHNY
jgi:hypothetical protein